MPLHATGPLRRIFAFAVFGLALPAAGFCDPILYNLRTAYFFTGSPGPSREITESGTFSSSSAESLDTSVHSAGGTPTTFTGVASVAGSPLELVATAHVSAGESVALDLNTSPFGATPSVAVVTAQLSAIDVLVTGGAGTGYLLPIFAIDGFFDDNHDSAYAQAFICAGNALCTVYGVGNSTGGLQDIQTTFRPDVSSNVAFTFDTPFTSFFFGGIIVNSNTVGTLVADGDISGSLSFRLLGYDVVDEFGNPIEGAVVQSALFPEVVPEPAMTLLLAVALGVSGSAVRKRTAD